MNPYRMRSDGLGLSPDSTEIGLFVRPTFDEAPTVILPALGAPNTMTMKRRPGHRPPPKPTDATHRWPRSDLDPPPARIGWGWWVWLATSFSLMVASAYVVLVLR